MHTALLNREEQQRQNERWKRDLQSLGFCLKQVHAQWGHQHIMSELGSSRKAKGPHEKLLTRTSSSITLSWQGSLPLRSYLQEGKQRGEKIQCWAVTRPNQCPPPPPPPHGPHTEEWDLGNPSGASMQKVGGLINIYFSLRVAQCAALVWINSCPSALF